ncbi:unknown [Bacteroides sp. CAG:144]|nr:unknown [Bacteroides sp. CAG:144]
MSRFAFVIEEGFEPSTHSLEGCCSIQLSYPTGHFSETLSSKKRRKGKRLYCKHQIGNRFFADAETPAHLATKDSLPNHL